MNTNGLSRHYDRLTPLERLPLIAAAAQRGDEVEGSRLMRSAPTVAFKFPDYYGHSDALCKLAWWHLVEVLDLAALYWRCEGLLESIMAVGTSPERDEERMRTLCLLAHRVRAERDGWALFCTSLNLDPGTILSHLPGYATVVELDEEVAETAFTPEEARAYLQSLPPREGVPAGATRVAPTAEGVAAGLRQAFDHLAAEWA